MKLKCNSCGGVYQDLLPDGTRYFHACPPVVQYVDKDGLVLTGAALEAARLVKAEIHEMFVERKNHRDENIKLDAQRNAAGLKAEGAGVTELRG